MIPLKAYFVGLGTEDCSPIINQFVWTESLNNKTICELYLHFSSHLMSLFHTNIKILEMKTTNATNLYDIMIKLNNQLENQLKHEFFGAKVSENLKSFRSEDKTEFTRNAKVVYKRAIDYLNKNFDFIESPFKLFSALNFDSELNF
jgi:hypothetical protein